MKKEFSQRFFTEKIREKIKLEQLKELSKKIGIAMEEIIFVGDSENDIDVFKTTGKGIIVPGFDGKFNEELRKVSWKQASSLSKIHQFI